MHQRRLKSRDQLASQVKVKPPKAPKKPEYTRDVNDFLDRQANGK